MAKKRDKSESEHLKGIIRNQKSIIKNLKKELNRYDKKAHLYDDLEEKIKDIELEQEVKSSPMGKESICPNCSKNLEFSDLGVRILMTCECGYRESKKK